MNFIIIVDNCIKSTAHIVAYCISDKLFSIKLFMKSTGSFDAVNFAGKIQILINERIHFAIKLVLKGI